MFRHNEASALVAASLSGDYDVTTVADGRDAIDAVRTGHYALVVCNDTLSDMTGEELATHVRELCPSTQVLITATRENAENALKLLGADEFNYVEKPLSAARIRYAATVALERVRLQAENSALRARLNANGEGDTRSNVQRRSRIDWSEVQRVFRLGSVRDMERLMILNRLAENGENRTRSAESLEISVRTLRNKLHEYNVPAKGELKQDPVEVVLV